MLVQLLLGLGVRRFEIKNDLLQLASEGVWC